MMNRILMLVIGGMVYFLFDLYAFQAVRLMISEYEIAARRSISSGYFFISALLFLGVVLYPQLDPKQFHNLRLFLTTAFFTILIAKIFMAIFLLLDDLRRLFAYFVSFLPGRAEPDKDFSRSAFLAKAGVIAGALPVATLSFGIISGAHDYRVKKRQILSKNLPKAFDGLRIVQISDIHTGSFFNKTAVAGGVDLINAQRADIVFFTGDLVNNESAEAKPYLDIFKKIKAPMGVFSTMGNHDYGDYRSWSSPRAKQADIRQLHEMHRYMGWDILLNENRILRESADQIAILGLENWGAGRFSKYGDMAKTCQGTEAIPFKILLSHDPSHWDAQVRPDYPEVDLMLAGHTHGMQFGVEIGDFRWSPAQYMYKQWADHYQEGNQHLYVNRGYGFIGYPGRVGILPEITVLELKAV